MQATQTHQTTGNNGEISVHITNQIDSIQVQISHIDIGISATELPRIFDEFIGQVKRKTLRLKAQLWDFSGQRTLWQIMAVI